MRDGSKRAVFAFELDHDKERAQHNLVKILYEPIAVSEIPTTVVSLLHGRAFSMDLKDLSRGDFLLPMYFLQKLALEPNKKEEMVVKIAKFLEDFINNIKIDPSFSFVYSVMTSYQPLLKSNGIIVAAAHLDGLSALAWHAVNWIYSQSRRQRDFPLQEFGYYSARAFIVRRLPVCRR